MATDNFGLPPGFDLEETPDYGQPALAKVPVMPELPTAQPVAPAMPEPIGSGGFVMPDKYVDAIKGFEGFTPQAKWDYQHYSLGYGTRGQPGETVTPEEADRRLRVDLAKAAKIVDQHAPNAPEGVKAALTSLTFNAGNRWTTSGLGEAVRSGDYERARDHFLRYTRAGGQNLPGLAARRQAEAQWFGGGGSSPVTLAGGAGADLSPPKANNYGLPPGFDLEEPAAEKPKEDEQGFFSGLWGALSTGARQTASSLKATAGTYGGSNAMVEEAAKYTKGLRLEDPKALAKFTKEVEEKKKEYGDTILGGIKNVAVNAYNNPEGLLQFVTQQAPNMAVAMGGGLAGAAAGTLGGPFAPITVPAGFIAGMFLGNTALETGGKAQEKAEDGFTDAERSEAMKEGAVKSGIITGIDTATLGVGRWILGTGSRAVERATAKVLADKGIDVVQATNTIKAAQRSALEASKGLPKDQAVKAISEATVQAMKGLGLTDDAVVMAVRTAQDNAIKLTNSVARRSGRYGGAIGLQGLGEGTGELLGEFAATGEWRPTDAVLEAVAGLATGPIEIEAARSLVDSQPKTLSKGFGALPSAVVPTQTGSETPPDTAPSAPTTGQPTPSPAPAASSATPEETAILLSRNTAPEDIALMSRAEIDEEIADHVRQGGQAPAPAAAQDQPSAEPMSDLFAQIEAMQKGERQGVYLSPDNLGNIQSNPAFVQDMAKALDNAKGAEIVQNVDGKGGMLITANKPVADLVRLSLEQGTDTQALLGLMTGAGTSVAPVKPADAAAVVQQKTPDGAVTRETAVRAEDIPAAKAELAADGRTVETVSPEEAIARREEQVAAEQAPAPTPAKVRPFNPTTARAAIKGLGGIDPNLDRGDLRQIIDQNRGLASDIFRRGGMSPDDMRQALVQRGFLADRSGPNQPTESSIQDLYDLVQRIADGERVGVEGQAIERKKSQADIEDEDRARIEAQIPAFFDNYGGQNDLTDQEVDRIIDMVLKDGMDVEDAIVAALERDILNEASIELEEDGGQGEAGREGDAGPAQEEADAEPSDNTGERGQEPRAEEVAAAPETGPSDSGTADWIAARDARIRESRAAGNKHLDSLDRSVEGMRGVKFYNVHDAKERGTVRTVANTGDVVVNWADKYSADKNLVDEQIRDGKSMVWQSWLAPTDLKDYAVEPAPSADSGLGRIPTFADAKALVKDQPKPLTAISDYLENSGLPGWAKMTDEQRVKAYNDLKGLYGGEAAVEPLIPGEPIASEPEAEKPSSDGPKDRGPDRLKDYTGITIDGYVNQEVGNEERDGSLKRGFLSDARDYLTKVSKVLKERGFEPHPDTRGKKSKPGRAVSVNAAGPAVSGDVYLAVVDGDGKGVYVQIGDALAGPKGGISLMARRASKEDRSGSRSQNQWLSVDLTVSEMADKLDQIARGAATKSAPAPAAEQAPRPTAINNLPDGISVELSDTRLKGDEARQKGGEYKAIATRQRPAGPYSVVDGYGNSPDEAMANALRKLKITVEPSGQTSLVPEATTAEKIAAESKKKEPKGKASATDDAGELFNPDVGKQADLVDMAKAAKAQTSAEDLRALLGKAQTLGDQAFRDDKPRAPAQNKAILDLISENDGRASDIMDAYTSAWDKANLAAPVEESAPDTAVTSNLDALFDSALDEQFSTAKRKAPARKSTKRAATAAKSAAANTAKGLNEAMTGLVALFDPKGRLGSGPSFDAETYAKAKPHFDAAISHFAQAGADAATAMRELIKALAETAGMSRAGIEAMRPYIIQYITDYRDGTAEQTDAGSSQPDALPAPDQTGDQADAAAGDGDRQQVGTGVAESGQGAAGQRSVPGRAEGAGRAGARGAEPAGEQSSGAARDRAGERSEPQSSEFVIDADEIGSGGLKKKYRDNVAAIRLLKTLEAEDRTATPEERQQLAKYVGWGAMKGPFDPANKQWAKQHAELKELLTPAEFRAARKSTLDAHYTSPTVVNAMNDALERMGYAGGRMLEPSVGVGNFFGLMPAKMRKASQLHGVELDSLTSRMVGAIYPEARVRAMGFEDYQVPSDYFDLVQGNPPFGNQPLVDSERSRYSGFSIHNYFLAKGIDKLRPGGMMQVVVSHNFLDAADNRARKWIAARANLVGAVRLPNTAFEENAGTVVVTDILTFQKKDENGNAGANVVEDWVSVTDQTNVNPKTGESEKHNVSKVFVEKPELVLGTPSAGGTMYRANEYTVEPNGDLKSQLNDWVKTLPTNLYTAITRSAEAETDMAVPDGVKVGSFFVTESGEIVQRSNDVLGKKITRAWLAPNSRAADRMKGMIAIRDALRTQMRLERSLDVTTAEIEGNRATLNRLYDAFLKKNGHINSQVNRRLFLDDTEAQLIQALEFDYDKGISKATAEKEGIEPREPSATKADIFKRRVAFPPQDFLTVTTAKDALLASLNYRGKVDPAYMSEVYGKDFDKIINELGDLVYDDPQLGLVTADDYLSGDVKTKLSEARHAASSDSKYERNVAALEKVIPVDKKPSEISVSIGAAFVPPEIYEAFAAHIIGGPAKANYVNATGQWLITYTGDVDSSLDTGKFGTSYMPARQLFQLSMLGRGAIVRKTERNPDGSTTTVVLEKETEAAREKQNAIRAEWKSWIWRDPARADQIATIYNEKMNRIVNRTYDGGHLSFPGMNPAITLLDHQKNGVWRGLQSYQVLYDHVVGAGKTFEMAALAMEMRRLGIARKPLFVVPNHLTLQWRSEFTRLYPGSNILAATPEDFSKDNRERLFSKIVTGDWDAVVIGHSSLKKIGLPEETERAVLQEQIEELAEAIEAMKRERGDRNIIRDMEKIRSNLEAKMKEKLAAIGARSKVVTFDELGIDAMFVDEMHEFKNLTYNSTMDRSPGMGNPAGSAKAFDLFVKVRWLFDTFGDKTPFITATGTPVSNSLVEMFNMQRYMQYPTLKRDGLHVFDAWAKQFGSVENIYEVAPSGSGYRQSTRFAKFTNLPALMGLFNSFADTVTLDDLKQQEESRGNKFPVPKMVGGRPQIVVAQRSPAVANLMGVPEAQTNEDGSIKFLVDLNKPIEIKQDARGEKWTVKAGDSFLGIFDTEQDAKLKVVERALTPDVSVDPNSILGRFGRLRELTKMTKGKVNALSLTGEANKAGLDYRLIDPSAPDFAGSKINLAVDNMVKVWKQWKKDKGTQLVFCDLSIPLSARASYSSKARRLYVRDDVGAVEMKRGTMHTLEGQETLPYFIVQRGDKDLKRFDVYDAASGVRVLQDARSKNDAIDQANAALADDNKRQTWVSKRERLGDITQEAIDEYNNENDVETDGVESFTREDIAGVSGAAAFSVYDDIKAKLIRKGVPEREIAFIHDYSTPTAKDKLFKAVNSGEVRFLLGSTPKMGAGTNVQKRLVGLHHIDAPWRPSDLEQREGRIIRRGNELYARDPEGFEVFIGRYATEQTYDTRRWQILEHKARGIEQLRNYDGTLNEIDDIEGEAANAADMKAAASGDPLILEETKLKNDVRRLEQIEAAHADDAVSMNRKAKWAEEYAKTDGPAYLETLQSYQDAVNANKPDADGVAPMAVDGKSSADKEVQQTQLAALVDELRSGPRDKAKITYRGLTFRMERYGTTVHAYSPTGDLGYWNADTAFSPSGFVQRMKNYVERIPGAIDETKAAIKKNADDAVSLRKQSKEPFGQAAELLQAREDYKSIQRKLMAKGPAVPERQKAAVLAGIQAQKATLDKLGFGSALKELIGTQDVAQEIVSGGVDRAVAATGRPDQRAVENIARFLKMGRPVNIPKDVVDRLLASIRASVDLAPRGVPVGAVSRIEPSKVKGSRYDAIAVVTDTNGTEHRFEINWSDLASTRAFTKTDGSLIGFFRLSGRDASGALQDGVGSVVGVDAVEAAGVRGLLAHESIHARRRRGILRGRLWSALVGHAGNLRILDKEFGTYLADIGHPDANKHPGGVTIRELYEDIYRNEPDFQERMDQEAVAIMVELIEHGALMPMEIAPIEAELKRVFRGGDLGRTGVARRSGGPLFALSPPLRDDSVVDSATGQSMRRELDSLGYYSRALEAAKGLKQAKGTPEQMLAQLKKAGVKDAEIEATGLRAWLDAKGPRPDPGAGTLEAEATRRDVIAEIASGKVPYEPTQFKTEFDNLDDISLSISDDIERALRSAGIDARLTGASAQSVSKYLTVKDGDRSFKLRVSDHADRHGSDYTVRIEGASREVYGHIETGERISEMEYGDLDRGAREDYDWRGHAIDRSDYVDAVRDGLGAVVKFLADGKPKKPASPSITRDEIISHLEGNRVGLREVRYGGQEVDPSSEIAAIQQTGSGWYYDGNTYPNYDAAVSAATDNALRAYKFANPQENTSKWSSYSLDPSNPTYRETVLHLPLAVDENGWETSNFRTGHFPEPNIVGHMMTSMVSHEGKPTFLIDQIQSDWGQKLRDGGVRDEAKIAELREKKQSLADRHAEEMKQLQKHNATKDGPPETFITQFEKTLQDFRLVETELYTAEAATPGNPLVNTTDQRVNTTLRRAIRQAAEADADYIAIPSGDTVLSYNPGDEAGMRGFYGHLEMDDAIDDGWGYKPVKEGIVPKNLRKLLGAIDKDSAKPSYVGTLDSPSGKTELGDGFTLFPLTQSVKWAVKAEGQPMFSAVPRANDVTQPKAQAAITEAMSIVSRIAGQDAVEVDFRDVIPAGDALSDQQRRDLGMSNLARTAGGFYQKRVGAKPLVALAFNDPAYDLKTTAGHEAYHHVETALATPVEMRLLRSPSEMARAVRHAAAEIGRPVEEVSNLPDYEIRAIAFQRYRRMQEEGLPTSALHIGVRRFWNRLIRVFQNVRNALRGQGFDSMESIFERARTGEMAARSDLNPDDDPTTPGGGRRSSPETMASFAGGSPSLDMRPEARKARAEEMGFDTSFVAYRGITRPYDPDYVQDYLAFQMFSRDADIASGYASTADTTKGGPNVIPAYLRLGKNLEIDAAGKEWSRVQTRGLPEQVRSGLDTVTAISSIARRAKLLGYDSITVHNVYDAATGLPEKTSTIDVIFDPSNIRSVNAAFDPSEDGSPQLMASFFPTASSPGTIIGRRVARTMARMSPLADQWRIKLQDKFLPMRRQQEAIEGQTGVALPINLDVYAAESLFHGRSGEQMADLEQKHVEPLVEVMRKHEITGEELGDYLYARHAVERNKAVGQLHPPGSDFHNAMFDPTIVGASGMSENQASAILANVHQGPKAAGYAEAARMVDTINRLTRDKLLSSGLISRETYDAWTHEYQFYVPLRGFETTDQEEVFPRVGRGFDIRGPESMRALGRRSKSDNPVAYVLLQAQQAIVRAEKNRVNKTLMRLVTAHPDPDVWTVHRGETRRRINPKTGLVENYFVPAALSSHDPLVVGVKIGGKQQFIKFADGYGHLARALKGVGSSDLDHAIVRNMMALTRVYAQLLTSWNPEFVVGNFFRDVQTALINSKDIADLPPGARKQMLGEALSLKSIRGIYNALRGDGSQEYAKYFEEFRQAGGKISFMQYNDVDLIKRRINSMLATGTWANIKRTAKPIVKYVEDLNTSVENGVRLSTYIAMRKAGISQDRAATVARELTVNFNRKGEWGPVINSAYIFFNASVQGSMRMLKALRSKPVRRAVYAIVAGGMAMEILNYLIAGDDDDGENAYEKIKPWIKERNMIFMLPGRKDYIQIPMPYGYNVPFIAGQKIGEMFRTTMGHGKLTPAKAAAGIMSAMMDSFNPLGTSPTTSIPQMAAPTILDPIVQVAENKSWFGGPIFPTKFDRNKPDSENYFSSVHPFFIDMAKVMNRASGGNAARSGWLDVSPEVLEHYAQFVGGGVSKFLLNATGSGQRFLANEEWVPEKTPIVRRLYGKQTTSSRRRDFFENWTIVDAAYYEVRQLGKAGDVSGSQEARKEWAPELEAYGAMKGTQKMLSTLSKEKARINLNREMDDKTKKAKLDAIQERENALILRALEVYTRAKKKYGVTR